MNLNKLNIFLLVVIVGLLGLLSYVFSIRDFKNQDQSGQAAAVPVIVFSGPVSENEKQELYNKLLNPYIDWSTESYPVSIPISVIVEKVDSGIFAYNIRTVFQANGLESFAYGAKGEEIPIWVPSCMGDCNFSEVFKQKYPQVITEYNKNNPSR